VRLSRLLDIALEEDDAGRLHGRQKHPQPDGQRSSVEAHDEQLTYLLPEFEAGF